MKRMFILFVAYLCLTSPLFSQIDKANNCMNRKEAVEALMSDASGIFIDLQESTVWSPYVDFGFGPGYEGLLPQGSVIDPAFLGIQPYPGETLELQEDAYFFWIDDDSPSAHFIHPTRFVLLHCSGEFIESEQGWWPVIKSTDGQSGAYFSTDYERISDNPPGYNNKEGLIAGNPAPSTLPLSATEISTDKAKTNPQAYGIVVKGGSGAIFDADRDRYCQDLQNDQGVPAGNIVKANGGGTADLEDLEDAIEALCNLGAGNCTKIYVRITSHGGVGGLGLGGDWVPSDTLCNRFMTLSSKGVPICYLIDACCSGSVLDANLWGAPPGSSGVTATDSTSTTHGGTYCVNGDTLNKITGSVFTHAMSVCQKDSMADANNDGKITDCEAFDWVKKKKPCYQAVIGGKRRYPAGPPTGTTGGNPNPQKESVKTMVLEVLDGQDAGKKYSAPQNETVKLKDGTCFKLSVPPNAKDIVWKVNGEPITDDQGQGKSEIKRTAPKAGETDVYMVTYIYNDKEYSYMMEVKGVKGKGIGEPIYPVYKLFKANTNPGDIGFTVDKVYPNPFSTNFNLDIVVDRQESVQLRLLDVNGRVHFHQVFEVFEGVNSIEIRPNSPLNQGLYFLQFMDEQGRKITKEITRM